MTRADVVVVVDAALGSRPAQLAKAVAAQAVVVGFLCIMAAAVAIDVALGRGDEWPS